MDDQKAVLRRYLQAGREAVLWKLDGLGEHDVRRPLVPTGTNLLGLVKHLTSVELGYFGVTFDRMPAISRRLGPKTPSRMTTSGRVRTSGVMTSWRATGPRGRTPMPPSRSCPWTPPGACHGGAEDGPVTLHQILVHVATETHRHAGHADIVRELIDGVAGLKQGNDNLTRNGEGWAGHRERVAQAARAAAERWGG
jgi:hypothetical protein